MYKLCMESTVHVKSVPINSPLLVCHLFIHYFLCIMFIELLVHFILLCILLYTVKSLIMGSFYARVSDDSVSLQSRRPLTETITCFIEMEHEVSPEERCPLKREVPSSECPLKKGVP